MMGVDSGRKFVCESATADIDVWRVQIVLVRDLETPRTTIARFE